MEKYRLGHKVKLGCNSSIYYCSPWVDSEDARDNAIFYERMDQIDLCVRKYIKYSPKISNYPRYMLAFDVNLVLSAPSLAFFPTEIVFPCVPDMFDKEDFVKYSIEQIIPRISPDVEIHQDKTVNVNRDRLRRALEYIYDLISSGSLQYLEEA